MDIYRDSPENAPISITICRVMPNICVEVGEGAIAYSIKTYNIQELLKNENEY